MEFSSLLSQSLEAQGTGSMDCSPAGSCTRPQNCLTTKKKDSWSCFLRIKCFLTEVKVGPLPRKRSERCTPQRAQRTCPIDFDGPSSFTAPLLCTLPQQIAILHPPHGESHLVLGERAPTTSSSPYSKLIQKNKKLDE